MFEPLRGFCLQTRVHFSPRFFPSGTVKVAGLRKATIDVLFPQVIHQTAEFLQQAREQVMILIMRLSAAEVNMQKILEYYASNIFFVRSFPVFQHGSLITLVA